MIRLLIIISLLISQLVFAKNCTKGQPCGNSCISWKKTCHVGSYSSTSSYQSKSFKSIDGMNYNNEKDVVFVNYVVYIVVDDISVRSKNDDSAIVIGFIKKDEEVFVSEIKNYFAKISYKGKSGWVNMVYLKKK